MRKRFLAVAATAVLLALATPSPARAQGMFYEIDLGRAAIAFWEDHRTETFAFVIAGQGILWNSDAGQPYVGEVGCAAVANAKKATFNCGELSDFSIEDDLSAASGKGKFDAMTIDFKTGKVTEGGKIAFNVRWKSSEDPTPFGGGGFFFDSYGIGVGTGAEIRRGALEGVKGGVTGSPIGRGPKTLFDAAILMGTSVFLDLHR